MNTKDHEFYTVQELAARWRVSHPTVLKLIEKYPVMTFRHPSNSEKRPYLTRRVPAATVELVERDLSTIQYVSGGNV